MELIPGVKPAMKVVNVEDPYESIDAGEDNCPFSNLISNPYAIIWNLWYYFYTLAGSAMTEILKEKVITPIEKCYVESGFCAYLVLHYDDPENPRLEAMNSVSACVHVNVEAAY